MSPVEFFLSHRLPLAREALRRGWEVWVAAPPTGPEAALESLSIKFFPLPLDRGGINPLAELGSILRIRRCFREVKPTLVHLVTIKPVLYGGIAAKLERNLPTVSAIPGLGHLFTSRSRMHRMLRVLIGGIYRVALRRQQNHVIFQNPEDQETFVRQGLVDRQQVTLIRGSGVDPLDFPFREEPRAGPPLVVLASRMLRDKGVIDFIEAADLLRQKGTIARFALVGDIDSGNPSSFTRPELRELAAKAGVEWWGHRTDMADVLAQCHVVCLPSYREGLPKILIEAAATGRPIIASDVPGCREVVRSGENGVLVPPRSTTELAASLEKLILEKETRHRMGRCGRQIFEENFQLEPIVKATFAVYAHLLSGSSAQLSD